MIAARINSKNTRKTARNNPPEPMSSKIVEKELIKTKPITVCAVEIRNSRKDKNAVIDFSLSKNDFLAVCRIYVCFMNNAYTQYNKNNLFCQYNIYDQRQMKRDKGEQSVWHTKPMAWIKNRQAEACRFFCGARFTKVEYTKVYSYEARAARRYDFAIAKVMIWLQS